MFGLVGLVGLGASVGLAGSAYGREHRPGDAGADASPHAGAASANASASAEPEEAP